MGGSLPDWMKIIDAELEAIYQLLHSKGSGGRVLLLVDCQPALSSIEKALNMDSLDLEGKAREVTLRRIVQEVS